MYQGLKPSTRSTTEDKLRISDGNITSIFKILNDLDKSILKISAIGKTASIALSSSSPLYHGVDQYVIPMGGNSQKTSWADSILSQKSDGTEIDVNGNLLVKSNNKFYLNNTANYITSPDGFLLTLAGLTSAKVQGGSPDRLRACL